ncbi:peptidoglycan editing factor PgeF [Caballeronia sp. SEWSISQ10-4 2]|uniref:peptidoglycan editing factor PgeF n=1 Tax=Caballeronia sp. SEWSISQ10-4 2 TaxID=2937438 RepID=UPI0026529B96|nr:peptidoglycan editing factor PgeF [Caballeronia sp. SEWSISQ10-4 2]MDN7180122.1 peptidoglycan editing factor PgeF [Caballeronia sp. SEWSISQ10-4 2]
MVKADFAAYAPLRDDDCLWPDWSGGPGAVSHRVHAFATTRNGGVSAAPYGGANGRGGLNLGLHTGDAPEAVMENRRRVVELTAAPVAWLEQVHGAEIEDAGAVIDRCAGSAASAVKADAAVTDRTGVVCVVMIADCLPVLLCDAAGRAVGAAHAGWRGLAAGIVEKTAARVAHLAGAQTSTLHAWLGPAIGPTAFEVGEDVLDAFVAAADPACRDATVAAFVERDEKHKYLADLYALARLRLEKAGVRSQNVHGGTFCTVTEADRFYSYRRDRTTGRMAAMIWLAD